MSHFNTTIWRRHNASSPPHCPPPLGYVGKKTEFPIPRTDFSIGKGDVIEILQNMTNVCVHPSPAVYEEVQNTWMPVRRVKPYCMGDCDAGHVSLKQISFCLICKLISIPHFLLLSQGRECETKITFVQRHRFKFIWKAGLSYKELPEL